MTTSPPTSSGGLTLYIGNKNYSSWSMRPWLALRAAGAQFEELLIPLDEPSSRGELLAHSPSGRVPALRHGELLVWESLAICEYAAELYPEARLWPEERSARAAARAVSCEMHAGFAALRSEMPVNIRRPPAAVATSAAARGDIERVRALWREARERWGRRGDAGFLFGDFTIADAMFAPVVTRFRSYAVPLDGVEAEYAATLEAFAPFTEWIAGARRESLVMRRYEPKATSS